MDERGQCPICSNLFPIATLPNHVEDCLSGGGASSPPSAMVHDEDMELALKLQAEMERELQRGSAPKPIDPDEEFARRLQQEEEERNRPKGIKCEICSQLSPAESLFILDECSHKFCKECLRAYVTKAVQTSVTTACPIKGCSAALSVRDMKELLPKPSEFSPNAGSKQATERLMSELRQIMKSEPDKQGYSVKPIKDNLYMWEVKFFNFDQTEPLAQDLNRTKKKHIMLHVQFPKTYPFNPPFIRVIYPRFAFRTGHVTIGGSICTEMLTNSGWTPANTVESALVSIRANLLLGGARLDLSNKSEYSEREAREAFERMRQQHGW